MITMKHYNDQQGKTSTKVQQKHSPGGGNHQLSLIPLNRKEIMPGTVNFPGLVRSWILEENLILPL